MPISKLLGGAAPAALLCMILGLMADGLAARSFTPLPGPPIRSHELAATDITILGPPGYCIDTTATRDTDAGVFVMMGDCARLYYETTEAPEISAVLTALVSGPSPIPQQPNTAQLERFFLSEAGRAALSTDGQSDTVEIVQTQVKDTVLWLQLEDSSTARPAGLSPLSWRALLSLQDRLVSLAVTAHLEEPLEDAALQTLLDQFIAEMLTANSQSAATE